MEKDSLRGHFEELLKERTGEYKMYPTEGVWNSIYHRLHTRRKWHFIGGGTFALMILAGVFVLMQDNTRPTTKSNSSITLHQIPVAPILTPSATIAAIPEAGHLSGSLHGTYAIDLLRPAHRGDDLFGVNPAGSGRFELPMTITNPGIGTGGFKDGEDITQAEPRQASLQMTKNEPLLSANQTSVKEADAALSVGPMKMIKAPGRYSWLFHFAPSVSFRTLKSKSAITTSNYGLIVVDNNGYDINRLVDQRPSVGFEVGSDLLYSLTSRLKLKAGLQFNYSRYSAKAVAAQPQPVTIALGGPGTGGIPPQMVSSTASYTNGVGQANNSSTWIPDQRVELSLPIGAEYQILRTRAFSWNVAGTFQPSYILNAKAFILSSDYKSYVQYPNLLRTWNMNVGAETFLRFDRGDIQIQIGPQFRYQLLPSFIGSYPVSEHIYDVGFKVGITKSIR